MAFHNLRVPCLCTYIGKDVGFRAMMYQGGASYWVKFSLCDSNAGEVSRNLGASLITLHVHE